MTVLFACSEQEGFVTIGSPTWVTSTSFHDSAFTNGALALKTADTLTGAFAANADIWLHSLSRYEVTPGASGTPILIKSGSTDVLRVHAYPTNPNGFDFEFWNGSAWVAILEDALTVVTLQDVDIHCKINASSGLFVLYQNGNQIASFSGDTTLSGVSDVDTFILSGTNKANHFSQILVETENTIGSVVKTAKPTADGALTDWSGTFADIDDAGLNDDGTLVGASINDDESSYVIDDPSAVSGKSIAAVIHVVRASREASGPQNLQLTTISGGTSYPSSSFALELGLAPYQQIRHIDPDTSASWTISGASNALMGIKAKT